MKFLKIVISGSHKNLFRLELFHLTYYIYGPQKVINRMQ